MDDEKKYIDLKLLSITHDFGREPVLMEAIKHVMKKANEYGLLGIKLKDLKFQFPNPEDPCSMMSYIICKMEVKDK